MPSIVFRENLRAELFTTVLFAVFLTLLWRYSQEEPIELWLLPVFMLLWVNLHPGFISGLALLVGYILLEICELPFATRRPSALERLRKSAPWLLASLVVSIINPWGTKIYAGIMRQNHSVKELGDFIGEWSKPNLSISVFDQMFQLQNPESSFWWLLAAAIVCAGIALLHKNWGAAVSLIGSVRGVSTISLLGKTTYRTDY